tara:strand:- start:279 stop:563 length:285 start_codon:yes stop_codon:yes gene_type:complete
MKDIIDLYYQLPIELRAKIMYSGWIVHPVAKIFKDFYNEEKYWIYRMYDVENNRYINCDFYTYLKGIDYLKYLEDEDIDLDYYDDFLMLVFYED